MIPIRLQVRNFMCYRGEEATLELDSVHLACLSGENGSGKSALLAAITWALWGKARDRVTDDELISQGATEMEVDYEFALANCRYRVVRKRHKKASSGLTILELHMRTDDEGDVWKPLTGHHVRDTQAKITNLLKMEYETFINSAFILQGRADEFTVKQPTERKKVLADILGLDNYDHLEESAKREAADRKLRIAELDARIAGIDTDLNLRPEHVKALGLVEADLSEKQAEFTTLKEELNDLLAQFKELQAKERRRLEIEKREDQRRDNIQATQMRIAQNRTKQTELVALLADSDEIRKGYADWQEATTRERKLSEGKDQLHRLELERSDLERRIDAGRSTLDTDRATYQRQINELERRLAERGDRQRQLGEVVTKLKGLELLQKEYEDAKCLRENLDSRMRAITGERDTCEKEGKQLRQKLDMILGTHAEAGHANCPLCNTILEEESLERVKRSFESDIAQKRREYGNKQNELEAVNKELAAVMALISKQAEQLKPLSMYQQRHAQYEQALKQLDADQEQLDEANSSLAAVAVKLDRADYAHDERKTLAEVEKRIKKLAYDPEEHIAVQRKLAALEEERYNERYHTLDGADRLLAQVREAIEVDTRQVESMGKEEQSDLKEMALLEPEVAQLPAVEAQIAGKKHDEQVLSKQVEALFQQQGDLRGKIERCDLLKEEKARLMEQYKDAVNEEGIYKELALAFGKKGIQTMIIENVLPELEDEANTLLGRMTDGRMNVQFATQRDARNNKSVIETLDINISDEMGLRSYELYSGGEAFRVNFAVRIALSKLLARRAGAQLQMLVIDEGFGTQDGQGRERLVGAIRSIQEDFEKIIVVTHIEELKGEFPVRIDVIKTDSGSLIMMN
jgi:exonuclease SbcC